MSTPTKKFTVREVNTIANKMSVEHPIGLMDKRWNLALSTLVDKLQKFAELTNDRGEVSNVRPIRPVKEEET